METQQNLNQQKWFEEMNDPNFDHFGALLGASGDVGTEVTP